METVDVLICGCGPTGAMLSAQLGLLGVKNIVLEKEAGITTDPRGIALDEDGIRSLQSVGIYDKIYTDIGHCMGKFKFLGGTETVLDRRPFMQMDYSTTEGGTGHVGFICHKQPILEHHLRNVIAANSNSELRSQCTMILISEDDEWVYATFLDHHNFKHEVRAKYLVGADGKTGYTRKRYLEPKGIMMDRVSGVAYEETWVAVNWKLTVPNPSTHPEFPFWDFGYTPEQVYDTFFPPDFRFLCNPTRPAVAGRFGLPEDRLWRFEFVVRKDEDANQMASEDALNKVVLPYFTRPGKTFGLNRDIVFPKDCIETLRARPFVFSARSCNMWALGRTILCGDSAHVFPPFGGQGITSGFRDACSLAWRLKFATQPDFRHHPGFLAAWWEERKQQLEKSLSATLENGRFVTESNALKIYVRDLVLRIMQLLPSWRQWLEQGARRDGMIRYKYSSGMHFLPEASGGGLFPQVYCAAIGDEYLPPQVKFTDDVIFAPTKRGLFQLVVLLDNIDELFTAQEEVAQLTKITNKICYASEATFIVRNIESCQARTVSEKSAREDESDAKNVYRVATAAEFEGSSLCNNRPAPHYYDRDRLHKQSNGQRYVVLRPDRFVFAASSTLWKLQDAFSKMQPTLDGDL